MLPDAVGRRVVSVSIDYPDARAALVSLAESLGFAAIELGWLGEGGRLIQARAPLVLQNLISYPLEGRFRPGWRFVRRTGLAPDSARA